jgi:uncharacterized protein YbjT (DUF2867 family)
MKKTALLIGATGLVGKQALQQLLQDDRFDKVKVFVRRTTGAQHPKLEEHIIDFDQPAQWEQLVTGDVLFSALGTTIRQAGSVAAEYKVDYDYQYSFAEAAARHGVPVYILISAVGANAKARNFYLRMKGELEEAVQKLSFRFIRFMRPSLLVGERKESRLGEVIGIAVVRFLNKLGILRKYTPSHANVVAQKMIEAAFLEGERIRAYEPRDMSR